MIESAPETTIIEKSFGRAVEHDAHAIEKINDAGSLLAHPLDERLIGQEITAVDRVVKMLPGAIALAFLILCGVDTALSAYGVGTLDWNDRKQFDGNARLGNTYGCHQSRQAAANDNNLRLSHFV